MRMRRNVSIKEAADHLLIFQSVLASLGFEETHTVFRQGQCDSGETGLSHWNGRVFMPPTWITAVRWSGGTRIANLAAIFSDCL